MEIADPGKKKRKHRPSVAVGLWIIKRVEKFLMLFSKIEDKPFFETDKFNWISILENDWQKIRKELDYILEHPENIPNFQDISKDQSNLTKDNRWKTLFLYGYGYKFDRNCQLCPETTKIIESIPGMYTAMFSVLSPGKHIPLHRGPYKGLLRCQLALLIPQPGEDCWIEVGGEKSNWEEGKCMVFDDTYKHQVQNNTEGLRVILFLDIFRPLRFPGSSINWVILQLIRFSPFIQDARKNQKAWEKRLGS